MAVKQMQHPGDNLDATLVYDTGRGGHSMKQPNWLASVVSACAALIGVAGIATLTLAAAKTTPLNMPAAPVPPVPTFSAPETPPNPNVSPRAADSEVPRMQGNVTDMMIGVFAAIERGDTAWLARTMQEKADREFLTEDDLHDAHRQFTWRSIRPYWTRVQAAWDGREYTLQEDDDAATMVLQVGGNLGEITLKFIRIDNNWYFVF
jgi:hypothetical protein